MTPLEWMMCGNTGMSSETILHVMEGTPPPRMGACVPIDPSDFGRCHDLLEAFPIYRLRLGEVAQKYPEWVGLVREWDRLTAMYLAAKESGNWKSPSLYDAMQPLIDEGRIAAGWVQTAPGCWRRGEHGSYKFGDGARIEF